MRKVGLTSLQKMAYAIYEKDAHKFVFGIDEDEFVLWTKDEHDPLCPEKRFPDYPYLRVLLDCLLVSGRWITPQEAIYALDWQIPLVHLEAQAATGTLFLEKSRQIMASWICCAYILWRAKFHAHQLCIVQSRKAEDAQKFVFIKEAQHARISYMEAHLPAWLQDSLFLEQLRIDDTGHIAMTKLPSYVRRSGSGHLFFPNGSHIWAVPQGGDVIRSNTPSILFSDEAAFQPDFGLAYQAALPALRGGGQGVFVSSAEVSDFATIIEAEV